MVQRSFIDREILPAALFARRAEFLREVGGRVRPSQTPVSSVPRAMEGDVQTFTFACV